MYSPSKYSRVSSNLSTGSQVSRQTVGNKGKRVQVWARIRPTSHFAQDNLELMPDGRSVNVHVMKDGRKGVVNNQIQDWSFRLDGIFHNATQDQVFDTVSSNIVTSALDGYNGTMMCYGQTGAGKTFTMTGATENYAHRGMIPRSISQLFREIEERPEFAITCRISYIEIYNETMFDLLSTLPESWNQINENQPMTICENEDGIYVKGLSCHLVQNEEEALNLLFEGETNRAIASHTLNARSSRSHCIFTIYIETRSRVQSNARYTVSKLNFVDLAGSERLGKTKSEGKTQQEAMYINKSLTFLEQVIVALADRRREHIPFRQSKLTHCLKDSIGGRSNTLLVANIWGESSQVEETVSTLRFATRMMCVASEPTVNEVYDPAVLVKKLQKEINHLKNELAMHDTLTNRSQITYDPLSEQQKYEIRQQVRRFVEGNLDEIDVINLRQIQGTFDAFRDIYQQMEKDIEERLRQKYALIDRTDPSAIQAAQQSSVERKASTQSIISDRSGDIAHAGVPISDDGTLVGESDGQSFGVGVAPRSARAEPSSVVQLKKKEDERRRREKGGRGARGSPVAGRASPAHSGGKGERDIKSPHTPVERERKEDEDRTTPTSSAGGSRTDRQMRPSTPPQRAKAFEEFKQERGSEINRILVENKEILATKKKKYTDLARSINQTKVEIDKSRSKLDQLKEDREQAGPTYNEDGDIVISEDEFMEIKRLKDLKQTYRNDFDELKNLKAEVQYCQRLVDQCRQRLIQEFDNWYAESFLNQSDEPQTSVAAGHGIRPGIFIPYNPNVLEDEQEKFDRLQMELLMNDPESAAFYNAKMRKDRRKTYEEAMSQPQPSYRRAPGTPTIHIRNQPPSMLQVSH
ncbi:kinesin-like protein KIF9 isoform X1 [Mercenaria mercenaria]|uniref:kinesin-like protein KIF9 isoform X1 n=1 Tax=Mercenaria mercenaria TaxID=6596 RepID=UPI001E1D307D|nr:kinesin-like protein KIF9 isoform X1 [Mercenaria mercenaria]